MKYNLKLGQLMIGLALALAAILTESEYRYLALTGLGMYGFALIAFSDD